MELYILMGICLGSFLAVLFAFRFLISDPQQGTLIGAAAGLLMALAAGFMYFSHLAACSTCP